MDKLRKKNIRIVSPTQIPEREWPEETFFVGSGSWAPDTSFRIWTDSEDNKEYARMMDGIYDRLDSCGWDEEIVAKILPLLQVAENSDSRGWAPIPERKTKPIQLY